MTCYVLLHYFEIVGVYSSPANAELGKRDGHVACLDPAGWHVQEWTLDSFQQATLADRAA